VWTPVSVQLLTATIQRQFVQVQTAVLLYNGKGSPDELKEDSGIDKQVRITL